MEKVDFGPNAKVPVELQVTLLFPVTMFEADGALEHRLHRSRWLKQSAELYDNYAEAVRVRLNELDPITIRPSLEKLGFVMIDSSSISQVLDDGGGDDDGSEVTSEVVEPQHDED